MSDITPCRSEPIYDLVGIGFGPSNLALAVAVAEHNSASRADDELAVRFLEKQPCFGWHRGMLIDDARMQVSFLKDLATLRNPHSRYSFLSYLHDRGRLVDFINCQSFFPTRLEFHDYLAWVEQDFSDRVDYSTDVVEIAAAEAGQESETTILEVVARRPDGGRHRYRTRNVVIATGLAPRLPPGVELTDRIWHNRDLVTNTARLAGSTPERFAVIGAGQSAAETVEYLHRTFPGAEVCAVFSRYGYTPADDTPFANRVFDPSAAEDFYTASPQVKDLIFGYHRNTNYSAVDPDLIKALYERHYAERVAGIERLRFLKVSQVVDLVDTGTSVDLTVESMIDGARIQLACDAAVYATGYRSGDPTGLLGRLGDVCPRDAAGRPEITRDYQLVTPGLHAGIYVQGATEHTHGIASTLLSNVALRCGEIVRSVCAGRRTTALPAGERWSPALSGGHH